jgi:NitT/TauT family transport system ATP-binding protein
VIAFERNRNRPEERERYGATISRDLEIFPRRTAEVRQLPTFRSGRDDPAKQGA